MTEDIGVLSELQLAVADALVKGDQTRKQIGDELGVSPRTMRRWLQEDGEFRTHIHELGDEAVEQARRLFRQYAGHVARRLLGITLGKLKGNATQVNAAKICLAVAGAQVEGESTVQVNLTPGLSRADLEALADMHDGPTEEDAENLRITADEVQEVAEEEA